MRENCIGASALDDSSQNKTDDNHVVCPSDDGKKIGDEINWRDEVGEQEDEPNSYTSPDCLVATEISYQSNH